jgi:hypothetical protein
MKCTHIAAPCARHNLIETPWSGFANSACANHGNMLVMTKLATHCAAAATARAIARMLFGNIPPNSTHTIGSQLKPKHTT